MNCNWQNFGPESVFYSPVSSPRLPFTPSLEPIMESAEEHPVFVFDLSYDLGYHFGTFSEKIKEMTCHIATKNDQFAFRVGKAIGGIYDELEAKMEDLSWILQEKINIFQKDFPSRRIKKSYE